MDLKLFLVCFLYNKFQKSYGASLTYINTERPAIDYFDRKFFNNITLTSRRIGRQDPRHYVELFLDIAVPIDDNISIVFYFYQFLTNRYRPSFIEMHFHLCDMIKNDIIFGEPVKRALQGRICPLPPGKYDLQNMTISFVPKAFPFTKGRIYANATYDKGDKVTLIVSGRIDMEVLTAKIKSNG